MNKCPRVPIREPRGKLRDLRNSGRLENMHFHREFGGRDRDRTGDPLLAKQVLSQLSYTPL